MQVKDLKKSISQLPRSEALAIIVACREDRLIKKVKSKKKSVDPIIRVGKKIEKEFEGLSDERKQALIEQLMKEI